MILTGSKSAAAVYEMYVGQAPPGRAPRITQEARAFMREKLTQEDRTWNATTLTEALEERLGIEVTPEALRQHLLSMGYS